MMSKRTILSSFIALFITISLQAQEQKNEHYTLVTYNVENLFDADGKAVFDDYSPKNDNGEPWYTTADVNTKIQNIIKTLKRVDDGNGPDIIVFSELESDFTPVADRDSINYEKLLSAYENSTLSDMLLTSPTDAIKDLPSEALLLKGTKDAGLKNYHIKVGFSKLRPNGEPDNVQKNVVFSRFPFFEGKTQRHPLENARPILETWIDVEGDTLVVFANHWKSGASSAELEETRKQNATVLRNRLDELEEMNSDLDIVVAGDLNSNYNQYQTVQQVDRNGINHILLAGGSEKKVATEEDPRELYNLWYELPVDKRGSEVYRGKLSAIMHAIINSNMYDAKGLQYVDQSFEVMAYEGLNAYSINGSPKRWSSNSVGSGFSDHFPLLFSFTKADGPIDITHYGTPNEPDWTAPEPKLEKEKIKSLPRLKDLNGIDFSTDTKYYNDYVLVDQPINSRGYIPFSGYDFLVFSFDYDVKKKIGDIKGTGKPLRFVGKLILYRNIWEFVIESPEYILED